MKLSEELFEEGHSLAWPYFTSFELISDALTGLHDFILSFPKKDLIEYSDGVWIEDGVAISSSAEICPPCIIGKGSEIRHSAFIRGNAFIGRNVVIGNSVEVKNAIISDSSEIPHFNYVGDSILGYKAHLGAGAITSNVKSDKSDVLIRIGDVILNTGRMKVGAFIGDRAEIGCNSVLNPGSVIGRDSIVYPLSSVRGFVPSRSIFKKDGSICIREL